MTHAAAKHREGRLGCELTTGLPPGALAQRARLIEAVWTDARAGARSVLGAMLPTAFLPPLADGAARLEAYAVECAVCPDGVVRVCRDDVGRHPGAALLEAPLLAVFLPALCRMLLGEPLRLPSLPAWWLGDVETRSMLAARPARFCLRDAFDPHSPPIPVAELTSTDRCRLQASMGKTPTNFVTTLNLRLQAHHHATIGTAPATGAVLRH